MAMGVREGLHLQRTGKTMAQGLTKRALIYLQAKLWIRFNKKHLVQKKKLNIIL